VRYGSVCSGIEAATAAWHGLGWKPSFFSEIEAFPCAVLQHHYPDVPLHGDFTTIKGDEYEPINLLVGGTPCQSFSIAGLRGGLDDDRGNLALEFLRLAQRTRPKWLVWENVPGVLSSNGGRDFGSIIGGMVEIGYGIAYRVLDAQYFGVAQRRRRVFVVGCLGNAASAAAVLFERHSLQGHPAPSREKGQEVAGTLESRASGGGGGPGAGTDGAAAGYLQPVTAHRMLSMGEYQQDEIASAMKARDYKDATDLVAFDTTQITSPKNYSNPKSGDACHPLAAGAHPPVIAFGAQNSASQGDSVSEHLTPTLDKSKTPAVAYSIMPMNSGKDYKARETEVAQPLMAGGPVGGNQGGDYVAQSAVRRLTPRECERLQGFPDDFTQIPYRNKPADQCPDGPRYKALGNSMAVPVMRWIGTRINIVEQITGDNNGR